MKTGIKKPNNKETKNQIITISENRFEVIYTFQDEFSSVLATLMTSLLHRHGWQGWIPEFRKVQLT